MGLYNMVFGQRPLAGLLVQVLTAAKPFDPGRFRDAWVEHDGEGGHLIRVVTRNGGGNREDQATAIASMQAHPWYVRDEDQGFDNTYADFYFRPIVLQGWMEPDTLAQLCATAMDHVDIDASWQEAIAALSKDAP